MCADARHYRLGMAREWTVLLMGGSPIERCRITVRVLHIVTLDQRLI